MKYHDADELLGAEALTVVSVDRFGDPLMAEEALAHVCRLTIPDSEKVSNLFFTGQISVDEYFHEMMALIARVKRERLKARIQALLSDAYKRTKKHLWLIPAKKSEEEVTYE